MLDKEIEERIKYIFRMNSSLNYSQTHEVVLCSRCKGIGFYNTEELVDYHKNDYITKKHNCERCKGDGRMIKSTESLTYRDYERTTEIPYVENKHLTDNKNKYEHIFLKIDNRKYGLENKYPELKALTYENYDSMMREILIQEALEKKDG